MDMELLEKLIDLCQSYLSVVGKERDAAAWVLAKIMVRTDCIREAYLRRYLEWTMQQWREETLPIWTQLGLLQSLTTLLKLGRREDLMKQMDILQEIFRLHEITRTREKSDHKTQLEKWYTKFIQRYALILLSGCGTASWRYQRRLRHYSQFTDSKIDDGSSYCGMGGGPHLMHHEEEIPISDAFDVPEGLESSIQYLLKQLSSKETMVRWSAAKGLGRISAKLPQADFAKLAWGLFSTC
jgi:hypothetical protein